MRSLGTSRCRPLGRSAFVPRIPSPLFCLSKSSFFEFRSTVVHCLDDGCSLLVAESLCYGRQEFLFFVPDMLLERLPQYRYLLSELFTVARSALEISQKQL